MPRGWLFADQRGIGLSNRINSVGLGYLEALPDAQANWPKVLSVVAPLTDDAGTAATGGAAGASRYGRASPRTLAAGTCGNVLAIRACLGWEETE